MVEVYPAASLKCWGLPHTRYKGDGHRAGREALLGQILAAAPWLDLGPHAALCARSDDALDAVVAALSARAAALGRTLPPQEGLELQLARTEGWIALPTGPLGELVVPDSG